MDTLKPRKYYNLTYSVIPDNKIRRVVGTLVDDSFSTENSYEEPQSANHTNFINRRESYMQGWINMPIVSSSADWSTYEKWPGLFIYNVNIPSHTSSAGKRVEKIIGREIVQISADEPIRFSAVDIQTAVNKRYVRTGSSLTGTDAMWTNAWSDNTDCIALLWAYDNGSSGTYSPVETNEYCEIINATVDSDYDGSYVSYDGKYLLWVYVDIAIMNNNIEFDYSFPGYNATVEVNILHSVMFTVTYLTRKNQQIEYSYHVDTADYTQYPLRIEGNEFTTANTRINGDSYYPNNTPWQEAIAGQLLDKYKDGKIFINAKVKASYLIENDLSIDSEIMVNDIDNVTISKLVNGQDQSCVFRIKNIEYTFNDKEFMANVILLEERTEDILVNMSFNNYFAFDLSRVTSYSIDNIVVQVTDEFGVKIIPGVDVIDNEQIAFNIFNGNSVDANVIASPNAVVSFNNYIGAYTDIETIASVNGVIDTTQATRSIGIFSRVNAYTMTLWDIYVTPWFSTDIDIHDVTAVNNETITSSITTRCYGSNQYIETSSIDNIDVVYACQFGLNTGMNPEVIDNLDTKLTSSLGYNNYATMFIQTQFVQLVYSAKSAFSCSANFRLKMDRPCDDSHFLDLPIEDFIDLSIDDMLEIYVD